MFTLVAVVLLPITPHKLRSADVPEFRIALNLKGIKFDYRVVNLLKGEQRGDDYTKMNSNQLVRRVL